MRYLGSKRKYAKELVYLMTKDRYYGQTWVEPFVGSASVIQWVVDKKLGNDSNHYLIALFNAIKSGWIPPETVTEEDYKRIKNEPDTPDNLALKAFVGFGCSFGGKFFNGYARYIDKKGVPTNFALQARNSLLKQKYFISDVEFVCGQYYDLDIPDKSIIYCDPPYRDTTGYKDEIDYDFFYNWLFEKHSQGHTIFVSEYDMPKDFKCIWQKRVLSHVNSNLSGEMKYAIEKLYTL